MIAAQLSEFRMHTKNYLDRVEEGESVQILRHGKPIAVLIPAAEAPVSRWKTAPPRIRLKDPKGPSLSETLIDERRKSSR
jgi:prevent-host-death family protein